MAAERAPAIPSASALQGGDLRSLTAPAHTDVSCFTRTSSRGSGLFVSMLGFVPGTLIAVGLVVMAVVLLGYFVYFFFIKK